MRNILRYSYPSGRLKRNSHEQHSILTRLEVASSHDLLTTVGHLTKTMSRELWQLIYAWLIPTLWAIWWTYWYVSSRNGHPTSKSESSMSRALHLVLVSASFVLIGIPALRLGPLGWRWVPRMPFVFILGAAMLIASLALAVWARRCLGQYWSGRISMQVEHRLIQGGPYSFVRHPIYTGVVGGMIGTAIALGELRGILSVLLLTGAYLRKIRIEEKWLVERFGQAYLDYRKEVKALIPFVV
jgi:protein-S-isoprenylcysteine O-methyltransferase Ste14